MNTMQTAHEIMLSSILINSWQYLWMCMMIITLQDGKIKHFIHSSHHFFPETDAHDKTFMEVDSSKCTSGGCDLKAFCACGTVSAEYQCVCRQGYRGAGLANGEGCSRKFLLIYSLEDDHYHYHRRFIDNVIVTAVFVVIVFSLDLCISCFELDRSTLSNFDNLVFMRPRCYNWFPMVLILLFFQQLS